MPHFQIHVAHGDQTATTELDLAGAEEVRLEAIYDAREMLVEGVMQGEDRSQWQIAVTDERGATVLELPFSQVFEDG